MEKILFVFAKQWIAGDSIDDALKSSKLSYKNGRHAIVNKLGEYQRVSKNCILIQKMESSRCHLG